MHASRYFAVLYTGITMDIEGITAPVESGFPYREGTQADTSDVLKYQFALTVLTNHAPGSTQVCSRDMSA